MIDLDRVSFGYHRQQYLFENLSLRLRPGHIYGLLGKNGAGKSSLLRNIAGLLFPNSGTIRVMGYEPGQRQPDFLREVFLIPEEIRLPTLSVARYAAKLAPFYPRFDEQRFGYYLAEFDVPAGRCLAALSYGQKKKVLIGFGLAANTDVLLMDEPTNGLDIPSKSQFQHLVAASQESNRLVLISTHQVRDLDNLIDSIIILEQSRILLHHSLEAVTQRLRFATLANGDDDPSVLYAEPSLRGRTVVMENPEGEDSRVDLERLFKAVLQNPERIRQLFTEPL